MLSYIIRAKSMRKGVIYFLLLLAAFVSCSKDSKSEGEVPPIDTIPMMVTQIQKCSRLYTSEYQIHKIVTHKDRMNINGSFLKKDFSIDLPVGERRIAIPMTATLKAYVDMNGISEKNIRREGRKITLILPDPKLVLTSTKVNNTEVKRYVALTRRNFSDGELASYMQQGRQSIINSIPEMGIIENARISAAHTIIPIIVQMGYDEHDITVAFRKDFTGRDLNTLLVNTTEEYGKDN